MKINLNEAFNPRQLEKFGFKRRTDLDFSDDGNRFKGYMYKDTIPVSYLQADGEVYISFRVSNLDLTPNEYMNLPSYRDADKYNGVSSDKVDINDLVKIGDKLIDEIKEVQDSIKPVDDKEWITFCDIMGNAYHKLYDLSIKEIKNINVVDLVTNFKYAHKYAMEQIGQYLKRFKSEEESYNNLRINNTEERTKRYMLDNFKDRLKRAQPGENFYYKEIKELVNKLNSSNYN